MELGQANLEVFAATVLELAREDSDFLVGLSTKLNTLALFLVPLPVIPSSAVGNGLAVGPPCSVRALAA
jgi:hypothetical protein